MCGIVGWLSWNHDWNEVAFGKMIASIRHRGPDAEGISKVGPLLLGHRRLSIIEPSSASNQPMIDHEGKTHIVFNGEIYNFKTLRAELIALGKQFRTGSDTEVILEAYKAWGEGCIQKFNGMFAFALWDDKAQTLLVVRDRLGEKPLFYMELDDGIAFASELPVLMQHPASTGRVNIAKLGHYLTLGYCVGSDTMVHGIKRLPAAHTLRLRRNEPVQISEYWKLAPNYLNKRKYDSEEEAAVELRELIDDSVKLRLVSDVPLGAFLSGGVDSSAIVASMATHLPREQIKTFTVGFRESGFDETAYAALAAKHLGVDHHQIHMVPTQENLISALAISARDPLADTSVLPTALLAEFTREHVTVALSGDGGDECFGGYETYVADRMQNILRHTPAWLVNMAHSAVSKYCPVKLHKVGFDYKVRQFLQGVLLSPARAHVSWRTLFTHEEIKALVKPEWQAEIEANDPFESFAPCFNQLSSAEFLDRAMYTDLKTWLADDILVKVDRATMAYGLESRAPLLDHRVVEFAASLPVDYKIKGFTKKHILKRSQESRLPASIIHRTKRGFNAPVSHWLQNELRDFAYAETMRPVVTQYLQREAIDKLWKDHLNGLADNGLKLFNLLCISLWLTELTRTSS